MVEAPVAAFIDAPSDLAGPQVADCLLGFSARDEEHTIPVALRSSPEGLADVAVHRLCGVEKLFL
jgi:hypothetical protein